MFVFIMASALCVAYLVLFALYSLFFKNQITPLPLKSVYSMIGIFFLEIIFFIIALSIPDIEFGNRFQHAMAGGFMSFVVCFLVVRDGRFPLSRLQFFIFSFLIVCSMGVANEILEYFAQTYANWIFAVTPHDTWLDLVSNTVGAMIGGAICTPFISKSAPHNESYGTTT